MQKALSQNLYNKQLATMHLSKLKALRMHKTVWHALIIGLATTIAGNIATQAADLEFKVLSTYGLEAYKKGAAEIVAHDPIDQRLYVVNGTDNSIDILDMRNPSSLTKIKSISLATYGKNVNSVAVQGNTVAVAVEAELRQEPGKLVIFDREGNNPRIATVGALPDMVTITPDQTFAVVANEGEPSKDYKADPEGSVSIVRLSDLTVRTVSFDQLKKSDFGPGAHFPSPAGTSIASDIEPEYVAVTPDSRTAFVSLQENNAIAVIDIAEAKLIKVFSMGYKDYSKHAIDVNDRDKKIILKTWPVKGLYQPDSIAVFVHEGKTYIVTANEGDARDYPGYSEEARVADLKLDEKAFPNAKSLQSKDALGRLKVTKAHGDVDGDGDHDEIITFGGRSFSILSADGEMVYDSGNEFERILSERHPSWFNSQGQKSNFDSRSDDKGVEPEGLALGVIKGNRYAFIGLERMSGVMIYDITNPLKPKFVDFISNGNPAGDPSKKTAGDVAPEGLAFIAPEVSPTGNALLATASEVSGTTTIWEIKTK